MRKSNIKWWLFSVNALLAIISNVWMPLSTPIPSEVDFAGLFSSLLGLGSIMFVIGAMIDSFRERGWRKTEERNQKIEKPEGFCPKCGTQRNPENDYCPGCGNKY